MIEQKIGQLFAVTITIGMGMCVQVRNVEIFHNPNYAKK